MTLADVDIDLKRKSMELVQLQIDELRQKLAEKKKLGGENIFTEGGNTYASI
jgi:hypothetical protein